MIYLNTQKQNFYNEMCEVIRLFLECEKIILIENENFNISKDDILFVHNIDDLGDGNFASCVNIDQTEYRHSYKFTIDENLNNILKKRKLKFAIKLSFYYLLKDYTKKTMPWGSLTGIRPTKMLRDLIKTEGSEYALSYMKDVLDVSDDKLSLANDIVMRQSKVISTIDENSIDIYINIPFCPSICTYCSFSSTKITHGHKLQRTYMKCLKHEITNSLSVLKDKKIRSIYVGGGTPTSLDLDLLEELLLFIKNTFDKPEEYTVEAGRPDTLSFDVLKLLKTYDVDRISINPQTMKQKTLKEISRSHTVKQFKDAFRNAKDIGFENINVDLIFGLPKEKLSDMKKTLKKVLKMDSKSITIHTLAIKNSSKLKETFIKHSDQKAVQKAVAYGQKKCEKHGYLPYYMYRQKYIKGNLENVGYAKAGNASIYNIDMMEEVCSVLAFGAGGISKRVYIDENRIVRSPNVKDVKTYITRHESMVDRKLKLFSE